MAHASLTVQHFYLGNKLIDNNPIQIHESALHVFKLIYLGQRSMENVCHKNKMTPKSNHSMD